MNHYKKYFLSLIVLSIFIYSNSIAGALTNASITPADTTIGAVTNYTIKFDSFSAIGTNENIYVVTSGSGSGTGTNFAGPNGFSSVIQPASLTSLGTFNSGTDARSQVFTGSVAATTTVEFVLSNVTNPTASGVSPIYTISVGDSGGIIRDTVVVPGINFTSGGGPAVTNMIATQTIFEDNGANAVDLDPAAPVNTDLNFVFTDDNAETLSFSIVAGHDATVVTPSISGNQLILSGLKTGSTNVTVRATDQSMNFVDETFAVNSIGALNPSSVTPAALVVSQTTDYTVVFSPAAALATNDLIVLSSAAGIDFTGSTLNSITGGSSLVASKDVASTASQIVLKITGGSAGTSDTITLVLSSVVNPGAPGLASDYTLRTLTGATTTGQSAITGSTYVGDIFPTVAHMIPGQSFNQEDGAITVDLDAGGAVNTNLNYTFVDGDGDPLTFTIEPGHNTNIVTASIVNDTIMLNGQGTGTTTVTVKADDMQDGSVTTTFPVTVVGSLTPAAVVPANQFTGATSNYVISLTPNVALGVGDRMRFRTFAEFDQISSALVSLSGGSITGAKTAGNGTETTITINSGSVTAGTEVTLELSGIINPTTAGLGDNYQINTDDGSSITGLSTVVGHVFSAPSVNIFADGFEDVVVVRAAKNTVALINKLSSATDSITALDIDRQLYQFMGEFLSLKNQDKARSLDEVLEWYKMILSEKAPTEDFDNDGISNEFDADPFGLSYR